MSLSINNNSLAPVYNWNLREPREEEDSKCDRESSLQKQRNVSPSPTISVTDSMIEDNKREFVCPIGHELMKNPVKDQCQPPHNFERKNILDFLQYDSHCPFSRTHLNALQLSPNPELQQEIEQYKKEAAKTARIAVHTIRNSAGSNQTQRARGILNEISKLQTNDKVSSFVVAGIVKEYEKRIQCLEKRIKDTDAKVNDLIKEKGELVKFIDYLIKQSEEFRMEVKCLEERKKYLENPLVFADAHVRDLTQKNDSLQEEVNALKEKINKQRDPNVFSLTRGALLGGGTAIIVASSLLTATLMSFRGKK